MNTGSLKVFTLFVALSVVFSGVAVAEDSESEEDTLLEEVEQRVTCNAITGPVYPDCKFEFDFSYDDGGADTVHESIETQMEFADSERESDLNQVNQYVNRTYGIAMSEAKLESVEQLNNGTSESEALSQATGQVNDFYSTQEKRMIETRNREVLKINETANTVEETDSLDLDEVITWVDESEYVVEDVEVEEEQTELKNGTNQSIYTLTIETDCGGGCEMQEIYTSDISEGYSTSDPFAVVGTDGDVVYDFEDTEYTPTFESIQDTNSRSIDNTEGVVEEVYDNYEEDELDASDILGPLEATQLASTSYEDTGKYSYLAESLEQMGLASSESESFTVSWEEDNETVEEEGQLFVDNSYSDSLESGESYTIEDTVYFVYQDSNESSDTKDLTDKEFTIEEMQDTDSGDEVNETEVQENNYYTEDTEDLESDLEAMREDFEELSTSSGGFAGFDGFNDFIADPRTLVAIALALIVVGASI